MDLCPVIFKSFVVQWSAKIASCQPQLKPLYNFINILSILTNVSVLNASFVERSSLWLKQCMTCNHGDNSLHLHHDVHLY